MTEDPYDILGVPRTATSDEIKKAYRKKARENHPDLNPDDPEAEERLKKINEAYDRITNPEKYAREDARRYRSPYNPTYTGYGTPGGNPFGSSGPGNPYGGGSAPGGGYQYQWVEINWEDLFNTWNQASSVPRPEVSTTDSAELRQAVLFIDGGNYKAALTVLAALPIKERTARWHYLAALANYGAGNTVAAVDQIRTARKADPTNGDYRQAEAVIGARARTYQQESESRGFGGCVDPSSLCCCLMCGPALCQPFLFCLSFISSAERRASSTRGRSGRPSGPRRGWPRPRRRFQPPTAPRTG